MKASLENSKASATNRFRKKSRRKFREKFPAENHRATKIQRPAHFLPDLNRIDRILPATTCLTTCSRRTNGWDFRRRPATSAEIPGRENFPSAIHHGSRRSRSFLREESVEKCVTLRSRYVTTLFRSSFDQPLFLEVARCSWKSSGGFSEQ